MSKRHRLKTLSKYYRDIASGKKKFELRKNDRGFEVGDWLELEEVSNAGAYTGCAVHLQIQYILSDFTGLEGGYVILNWNTRPEPEANEWKDELRAIRLDIPNHCYSDHVGKLNMFGKRAVDEIERLVSENKELEEQNVSLTAENKAAQADTRPEPEANEFTKKIRLHLLNEIIRVQGCIARDEEKHKKYQRERGTDYSGCMKISIEAFNEELDWLHKHCEACDQIDRLTADLKTSQERIAKLEAHIDKYGRCRPSCDSWHSGVTGRVKCTCGFEKGD